MLDCNRDGREQELGLSAEQRRGQSAAFKQKVIYLDLGHHFEQLASEADKAPVSSCHLDLAGFSLRIGDKLGNRFGRNRRVHHYNEWIAADARDGRRVTHETKIEFFVQYRRDHL